MCRHEDELRNMIANRLSNAMYKAGYTYTTLALKLGRAEYTTRCWMTGTKIPTLTKFIEMAVIFNCSTDYLLGFSKDFEGKEYSKSKQVARCGNAVTPPVATALVRANLPEYCNMRCNNNEN